MNQKAHDALADVNALWDVIKRLLFPKIDSADKVADNDAEDRLMNCYACSESFKTFPAELRKGARVFPCLALITLVELQGSEGAPKAKKKKRSCMPPCSCQCHLLSQGCPSCGAADHLAKSNIKCPHNQRKCTSGTAAPQPKHQVPITQFLAPTAAPPAVLQLKRSAPELVASKMNTADSDEGHSAKRARHPSYVLPASNRPQRPRMTSVRLEELE